MSNKITLDICGITAEEATLDAGLFLSLREERALADRLAEVLEMTAILRCADLMRGSNCGICPPCEARAALAAHAERRKP